MTDFSDPQATLDALRRLLLLGFRQEWFRYVHHDKRNGTRIEAHVNWCLRVGRFVNRGGNIATAQKLWALADEAEKQVGTSHPWSPRPELLHEDVADGVRLLRDHPEQNLGHRVWMDLLARAGWRGRENQERAGSKGRGGQHQSAAVPTTGNFSVGLYIVVPRTTEEHPQPIDQDKRRRDKVPKVWRAHCKFGQSRDLASRERAYNRTFAEGTPPGVEFCVVALLPDGIVDKIEVEVLARLRSERLENEKTKRLLEWMKPGVEPSVLYEVVAAVLEDNGQAEALLECLKLR